ncbi:MAG: YdcF family protein [Methylocystis sp.]
MTTPLSQGENKLSAVRKIAGAIFAGGAFAGAAFLFGFAGFALSLPRAEFAVPARAEGIVALTGGSDRVLDAATLLASGQARRMLITGVNRATRSAVIAKILPVSRQLFDCCVDLGYQALDTAGNAKETRAWARQHNITRTLIVVTSNYHMPRALVEISAALPDVELYPFPVISEHIDVADWVSNLRVARFIGKEYVKYLGSLLRTKVMSEFADSEPPPQHRHSVAFAGREPG